MRLTVTILLFYLWPSLALAATCADLPPADGSIGYRVRSAPTRCEGFYQSPVSGEILELLSFVRHPITFDPHADKALTITAPSLSGTAAQGLGDKLVDVVGRALPLHVYYRMDAQLTPGKSLSWPIEDVVVPAGLAPSDLGLIGIMHGQDGPVFVPLDVAASKPSAGSGGPIITFRPSANLDSLQWRLYSNSAPSAWKQVGEGRTLSAGEPVAIKLDGPPGELLTLEIAAKPGGSEYVRTRFQILLP
jgi:hypothetical protein